MATEETEAAVSAKHDYTTKQMGDACEMLIAAELTLAGVPAMKAPDYWPGYDVVAQPPGAGVQRVSVKSRTFKKGPAFVRYSDHDQFDWLAIVILPTEAAERRSHYVVPRKVCDSRFRAYERGATRPFRELRIEEIELKFGEFKDNFRLAVTATLGKADDDG